MNKLIEEKRLGRFQLTRRFLNDSSPEELNDFFKGMIIIKAEFKDYGECIEYTAFNKSFKKLGMGEMPGFYDMFTNTEI